MSKEIRKLNYFKLKRNIKQARKQLKIMQENLGREIKGIYVIYGDFIPHRIVINHCPNCAFQNIQLLLCQLFD